MNIVINLNIIAKNQTFSLIRIYRKHLKSTTVPCSQAVTKIYKFPPPSLQKESVLGESSDKST